MVSELCDEDEDDDDNHVHEVSVNQFICFVLWPRFDFYLVVLICRVFIHKHVQFCSSTIYVSTWISEG